MKLFNRASVVALITVLGVAAQAVTFSSISIQSAPLSNGASWSTSGNSISFFAPNAVVGDPTHPLRAGTLNIQYDVASVGAAITAVGAGTSAVTLGSGSVIMNELVFALDSNGNELGQIGSYTHVFNSSTSAHDSASITLSSTSEWIRVKKSFTLVAPDTAALDLASVAIINQNVQVVPEPASIAALSLGALALVRRRRNSK